MTLQKYSLYLNEFRKNLAANLDRSSLIHSYGYASADDQPTLAARFVLATRIFQSAFFGLAINYDRKSNMAKSGKTQTVKGVKLRPILTH